MVCAAWLCCSVIAYLSNSFLAGLLSPLTILPPPPPTGHPGQPVFSGVRESSPPLPFSRQQHHAGCGGGPVPTASYGVGKYRISAHGLAPIAFQFHAGSLINFSHSLVRQILQPLTELELSSCCVLVLSTSFYNENLILVQRWLSHLLYYLDFWCFCYCWCQGFFLLEDKFPYK